MKFNLKNRPRPSGYQYSRNSYDVKKWNEEWFEGFEKELRSRQKIHWSSDALIKEILGE